MIEHRYTDMRIRGTRRLADFDGCQLNEPLAMHVSSDRADEFRTSLRVADLRSLDVVAMEATTCRIDRAPSLVAESDPEVCAFVLPINGGVVLHQEGREAQLNPDQIGLYSSSTPFRMDIVSYSSQTHLLRVQLPKARLALPDHAVDGLAAVPISSTASARC